MFLRQVLRVTGTTLGGYVRALSPAAGATLVMAAAVLGARFATPHAWAPWAALVTQVATGSAVYAAVLFAAHRHRMGAFLTLVRTLRC